MDTNTFVESLRTKFGYSEELTNFLKKAVPAIIQWR